MATFNEFKDFIKNKPFLKEKVKNNQTTWQELYERYDLYGPEDEIFTNQKEETTNPENKNSDDQQDKEKESKTDDSFSSFFNMISGIDVDKISDGLNGMKKILNILSEITTGEEATTFSSRRNQKPYKRDDD